MTFVDISSLAVKTVSENLNSLKVDKNEYEILKTTDVSAIELFKEKNRQFDVVFLDPPYEEGEYEKIVALLQSNNLLSDNAILVLESNRPIKLENIDYQKNKEYHYGEIMVFIYWR